MTQNPWDYWAGNCELLGLKPEAPSPHDLWSEFDRDTLLYEISPGLERLTGDVRGQAWIDFLPKPLQAQVRREIENSIQTGRPFSQTDWVTGGDGKTCYRILFLNTPKYDEAGTFRCFRANAEIIETRAEAPKPSIHVDGRIDATNPPEYDPVVLHERTKSICQNYVPTRLRAGYTWTAIIWFTIFLIGGVSGWSTAIHRQEKINVKDDAIHNLQDEGLASRAATHGDRILDKPINLQIEYHWIQFKRINLDAGLTREQWCEFNFPNLDSSKPDPGNIEGLYISEEDL